MREPRCPACAAAAAWCEARGRFLRARTIRNSKGEPAPDVIVEQAHHEEMAAMGAYYSVRTQHVGCAEVEACERCWSCGGWQPGMPDKMGYSVAFCTVCNGTGKRPNQERRP